MKIRIVLILFFCVFAVSLSAQTARNDSIVSLGSCATPGACWNVVVRDSIAYVADGGYVTTVNVSIPSNPWVVCSLTGWPVAALGIFIQDTVAYCNLTGLGTAFTTIGIAKPDSLYLLGSCHLSSAGMGDPTGIVLKDTIIYLASSDAGVLQINVADPSSPDTIKYYDTPGGAMDLAVKDTLVYIADVTSLQIANFADPMNPSYVGSISLPSSCRSIFLVDSFAYVTCISGSGLNGSLEVVKVSNPASPQIVASADNLKGDPLDVWVSGNYAYVAAGDFWEPEKGEKRQAGALKPEWTFDRRADEEGGLRVIDISSPLSPSLVASYDTPGDPRGVFAVDSLVFIADYSSLQILKHLNTGIKEISYERPLSSDLGLQIKPNPFSKTTTISYHLSFSSQVHLEIFDITGRSIKLVYNGYQNTGKYEVLWDGNDKVGNQVTSGVYFLRMTNASNTISKKILMLNK